MNEEDGIGTVLSRIPYDLVDEILVVDKSSDRTPEIAEEFGATVVREPRKGYGRALQTGIENSHGDIIVYIDGDSTYDPSEISKIIEPIQERAYDVVIGNRLEERHNRTNMPFQNRVGNWILSRLFGLLFHVGVGDTQCGLRGLLRSPLLNYEYQNYGMAYVTEQLTKLVMSGLRVGEVSISYKRRTGRSKLRRFRDGFQIVWTILIKRYEHWKSHPKSNLSYFTKQPQNGSITLFHSKYGKTD